MNTYTYYCYWFLLFSIFSFGQSKDPLSFSTQLELESNLQIPFHHARYAPLERALNKADNVHTSVKPYSFASVTPYVDLNRQQRQFLKKKHTWVGRKLWNEHLATVKGKDYWFTTDLLLDLELGKDISQTVNTFNNTRILQIQGAVGSKLSFSTRIYEAQSRFANYINESMAIVERQTFDSDGLVFGRAKAKRYLTDAFDYQVAESYLNYRPSQYFEAQFGQGKNFIGDGYRSLILSDIGVTYPYLKFNTRLWKFQYTNLWMWMSDIRREAQMTHENVGRTHPRKYVSLHHLGINITNKLNIGIFESIMTDNSRTGSLDMDFFNPIIFLKPAEYARGEDAGSAIVGMDAKYKFSDRFFLYGQFVIDEFTLAEVKASNGYWANKFAAQLGFKYFDVFGIPNLFLQMEYNQVRPYTFSHRHQTLNYGNYGQAIGHPWGANFRESILISRYSKGRFSTHLKWIFGSKGYDEDGLNYGGDIFKSYDDRIADYGIEIGQGAKATLNHVDFQLNYLLNPVTDMKLFARCMYRQLSPEIPTESFEKSETIWLSLGVKVDLFNWYLDY